MTRFRAIRGGCYFNPVEYIRSEYRRRYRLKHRIWNVGFRFVVRGKK